MTPLTEAELREMEQRCEAASKGPWFADASDPDDCVVWDSEEKFLANVGSARLTPVLLGEGVALFDIEKANCEFTAHARTDLPRAIQEIRRLKAELVRYAQPHGAQGVGGEE